MRREDFRDARLLVQCLFEMTDPDNPEAEEAADMLDALIDRAEAEVFPPSEQEYTGKMDMLRRRLNRIRRKVQNASTQEDSGAD